MEMLIGIIQIVLDFLADQGLEGQEQILALVGISMGSGAALLHPTIALLRNLFLGGKRAVQWPGEQVRARRLRKFQEEKEKRDLKKLVKKMAGKLDRQEKTLASLKSDVYEDDSCELVLADLDDCDLEELDLD